MLKNETWNTKILKFVHKNYFHKLSFFIGGNFKSLVEMFFASAMLLQILNVPQKLHFLHAIMLKYGQTYFKNFAVWTPQDFQL